MENKTHETRAIRWQHQMCIRKRITSHNIEPQRKCTLNRAKRWQNKLINCIETKTTQTRDKRRDKSEAEARCIEYTSHRIASHRTASHCIAHHNADSYTHTRTHETTNTPLLQPPLENTTKHTLFNPHLTTNTNLRHTHNFLQKICQPEPTRCHPRQTSG